MSDDSGNPALSLLANYEELGLRATGDAVSINETKAFLRSFLTDDWKFESEADVDEGVSQMLKALAAYEIGMAESPSSADELRRIRQHELAHALENARAKASWVICADDTE